MNIKMQRTVCSSDRKLQYAALPFIVCLAKWQKTAQHKKEASYNVYILKQTVIITDKFVRHMEW